MNMASGNMQHWKNQKKNFTFGFLFIYCDCYWLYHLIDFLRLIDWFFLDRLIDFLIFFNRLIKFFNFFKMIDHRLKSIKNYLWSGSLCLECIWRIVTNSENVRIHWSVHYLFAYSRPTFTAIIREVTYVRFRLKMNLSNKCFQCWCLSCLQFGIFFNISHFTTDKQYWSNERFAIMSDF